MLINKKNKDRLKILLKKRDDNDRKSQHRHNKKCI